MKNNRISLVWFGRGITNIEIQPKTQRKLTRIISSKYSRTTTNNKFNVTRNVVISENVSNLGKSLVDTYASQNKK